MAVAIDKSPRELLLENWGGDGIEDIEECLRRAERADSSTPRENMKRCPRCGGVRCIPKTAGWKDIPHRKNTAYKCGSSDCGAHFDEPAPSIAEVREDLLDELPEAAERAGRLAAVLGGVER